MKQFIILDRDGVINHDSDQFIKSAEEFIVLPGSLEAIARLCQAGYKIIVATNQSGIFRQLFSLNTLEVMHNKLQQLLQPIGGHIEQFYFCPHGPDDKCHCRKPLPGMILQIAKDFSLSTDELSSTYVVGDSLRDLDAGLAAGTKVALVKTGKGLDSLKKITEEHLTQYSHVPVYNDLADFTHHLLQASIRD